MLDQLPSQAVGRRPARPPEDRTGRLRRGAGRTDWLLVAATATLCLLGALSVYAATRNDLRLAGADGLGYLKRDALNIGIGAVLASPAVFVDYRQIRAAAGFLYAGAIVLLLAVLTPLGSTINGAHAWFSLGSVQQRRMFDWARCHRVTTASPANS